MTHILVTNDDGIHAPGLLSLAQEMRKLGKVSVLAPDRNWSASGHVKTLDRPLRIGEVFLSDGSAALSCDGAPSDCVALAICGYFQEKIDLVVSGINPYANLGHDVTYSGTVTAAMEAAIWEVPSIAVSLDSPEKLHAIVDYGPAAVYAGRIAQSVLHNRLPHNTLLNVNVPYLTLEMIKGVQVTHMGLRVYHDRVIERKDPRGKPYYWVFGDAPSGIPEEGSDIGALADGYVSLSPIHLDLTNYYFLPELKTWSCSENQKKKLPEWATAR